MNKSRHFCSLLFSKQHSISNYLHSVYIVLSGLSNLEMISSMWEDIHRLLVNTIPASISISILRFEALQGVQSHPL